MSGSRTIAAVVLISLSIIDYQVAIVQLFSLLQWYHYASLVISVALLGFGAAGTVLSIRREWLMRHFKLAVPSCMIACAWCMMLAIILGNALFARFDSYLLFAESKQWLALLLHYFLFLLPFFFGALALGMIFLSAIGQIGKIYFANLSGSGAGAILAAPVSWWLSPASLPAFAALFAVVAAMCIIPASARRLMILIMASFLVCITGVFFPLKLNYSSYKSLSKTLTLPGAKVVMEERGPYGYVHLVESDALRYAPALSLSYQGEVPVKKVVFNNADWFGPLASWRPGDSMHLLDYSTMALPYAISRREKVLVLQAETGFHVAQALAKGATKVDAVESNAQITRLLQRELLRQTDSLFRRKPVHLFNTHPRVFIAQSNESYDLIQLPALGAFGGAAGIFAMKEEFTYTRDAFSGMINLLNNDGVICVTAWMDYPYRNGLKLAATLYESAIAAGMESPIKHIIAIRNWGTITFVLKRNKFTVPDYIATRLLCDKMGFDPVLLPGISSDLRMFYNKLPDTTFLQNIDRIFSGHATQLYNDYDFNIKPATDDQPFFSQFMKWSSLPRLNRIFGSQSIPFLELGWLVAVINCVQLIIFAFILILLPLYALKRRAANWWVFLYFGGLGTGYMLIEIMFIQQLILFTGNAVYASALVLAVMLLSSGLGSYGSGKLSATTATMQKVALIIITIFTFYFFIFNSSVNSLSRLPEWSRTGLLLLCLALPGFIMGMPFPLGLRFLDAASPQHIPWAWGINNCMSVVSAAMASLIAAGAGFSALVIIASLAYFTCLTVMFFYQRKHRRE